MPCSLGELTQHHHEVARMNSHLVGAESRSFIRAGARKVKGQQQENRKPCFKHRTPAVARTTRLNVIEAHVSGLSCQNTVAHVTKMTAFLPAEVTDGKDGDTSVGAYLLGWERRSSSPLPDS